jgi:hypothetical protein
MATDDKNRWPEIIGAFLINFGAIEMLLLQWIRKFSTDSIVCDIAIDLPLNKRLALVCQLLKRSDLSEERKKRALELWGDVAKISDTRNIIAHSPFVTHQNQNGFIDVKKLKGIKDGEPVPITPLTLTEIASAGGRLSKIFQELAKPF